MKKIIFILIAIAAIACACKKYEEGPLISFISAKNRVYGTYTLVSYTVNDQDSLSSYKNSLGVNFEFYHNEFLDDDRLKIFGDHYNGGIDNMICRWTLVNKNKILNIIGPYGAVGPGPFGYYGTIQWEIIELRNKDIKLKTQFNGKEYFIHLK